MDLVNALNALPPSWTGWMTAGVFGSVALIAVVAALVWRRRGGEFAALVAVLMVIGLILALGHSRIQRDDQRRDAQVQIVAQYLSQEHDLVLLEPVELSSERATGRVATPTGEVRWATLEWLTNAQPALEEAELPADTNKVTLTLTDTRPSGAVQRPFVGENPWA